MFIFLIRKHGNKCLSVLCSIRRCDLAMGIVEKYIEVLSMLRRPDDGL